MMTYAKLIGCGCIALLALGCGSKGDGEDDGGDETGGSSSGGSSTGGSSTGGSGGSGGSSGSGGALPVMTTMSFSDAAEVCPVGSGNTVTDCWKLVDSNAMNADDKIPVEDITYQHNADDGDPEPGAFEATIPYALPSQWVSFGINFNSQDLTRRIIKARVKVVSGLGDDSDPSIPAGGTKVYAKSGMGYCYANGMYTNLGDDMHPIGEWQDVEFNLLRSPDYEDPMCAEPFDPSDVREIGVQFDSGSTSTTATTAVVLIDTVAY